MFIDHGYVHVIIIRDVRSITLPSFIALHLPGSEIANVFPGVFTRTTMFTVRILCSLMCIPSFVLIGF